MTRTRPAAPASGPDRARRTWLAAAIGAPWLAGCASNPLPVGIARMPGDEPARLRLRACREAHGLAALPTLQDVSVSYDGRWRPFIDRVQPEVVDRGFRASSEERLVLRGPVIAQAHRGPAGSKHVVFRRRPSPEASVWYNGAPNRKPSVLAAAALVADAYGLFLLGPLWLEGRGDLEPRSAGTVRVDGRDCDLVETWLTPGLGLSALDRVVLAIDRRDGVMRRVRFTLEGYEGTQGAVAEVDTFDHQRRHGILWPTRFYERVVHPVSLPAHDWRMVGLDVNRGLGPEDLVSDGPAFGGKAGAAAKPLGDG